MNLDPALVEMLAGRTPQQFKVDNKPKIDNPTFLKLLEAQRQSYGAVPSQDQFNGIIDPGDIPNSKVIDTDQLMIDNATKQSSEQPNYRPELPFNFQRLPKKELGNMLRLLQNYQQWKQGQEH